MWPENSLSKWVLHARQGNLNISGNAWARSKWICGTKGYLCFQRTEKSLRAKGIREGFSEERKVESGSGQTVGFEGEQRAPQAGGPQRKKPSLRSESGSVEKWHRPEGWGEVGVWANIKGWAALMLGQGPWLLLGLVGGGVYMGKWLKNSV